MTVELKNDLAITGILHSVDQYLNIKLTNTHVQNETKYPHMVSAFAAKVHAGVSQQQQVGPVQLPELGMTVTVLCSSNVHQGVSWPAKIWSCAMDALQYCWNKSNSVLQCWLNLDMPLCAAACRCLCATVLCVGLLCVMCW